MSLVGLQVPIEIPSGAVSDAALVGCDSCVPTPVDPDESLMMLYPTGHDIDIRSGTAPVPLLGGAILKIPAPGQVDTGGEGDKISAILDELDLDGIKELDTGSCEEGFVWDPYGDPTAGATVAELILGADDACVSEDTERPPVPDYAGVNKAKRKVNEGLIKLAANPALTNNFLNIVNLQLIVSTTYEEDTSPISTGEEASEHAGLLKPCFELTFVPIEVLAGGGVEDPKSIAAKFGKRFRDVYGICGNTYDVIASYTDSQVHSGSSDWVATEVAAESVEPLDDAGAVLAELGANIDILALLAKLFNLDMFPIDLEQIIKALAGEALAAALSVLEIEFLETLVAADQAQAMIALIKNAMADSQVRELLLEFFPIEVVSNAIITGESTGGIPRRGFFTIHEGYIYLKLPDMSGMDSGGFCDEKFYEEKDGEHVLRRLFYIEQRLDNMITRWPWVPQPPPLIVLAGEMEKEFPDSEDLEITVDGVQGQDIVSYYLSPIVDIGTKTVSPGLTCFDDGIELFTAPLITKFIFAPDADQDKNIGPYDNYPEILFDAIAGAIDLPGVVGNEDSMGSLFEIEYTESYETINLKAQAVGPSIADNLISLANNALMIAAIAMALGDESTANASISTAKGFYTAAQALIASTDDTTEVSLVNIGFPLSYPSAAFQELQYLLGEKNRSDIILSENATPQTEGYEANNDFYVGSTACYRSPLFGSNRPRFCGTSHIPAEFWIPGEETGTDENGFIKVSFKADSINTRFAKRDIRFAVYAMDSMGQLIRAPNALLTVKGYQPSIDEVLPSGCAGGGRILSTQMMSLRLVGSNMGSVTTVTFESPTASEPVVITSNATDKYIFTVKEDVLTIGGIGTTFGANGFQAGNTYSVLASGNDGDSKEEVKIYISSGTEDLPVCSADVAIIPHDSLKYPGFKKEIYGVPLYQDGATNAQINIKAKSKIFNGQYSGIYAYLAVLSTEDNKKALQTFCFEDDTIKLKMLDTSGEKKEIILVKSIEYEYSATGTSEFYKRPAIISSGKAAILEFPSKYSKSNFSSLIGVSEAYFVITNRQIDEYGYSEKASMDETTYSSVKIFTRNSSKPAFVSSPRIVGAIVQVPEPLADDAVAFNTLDAGLTSSLKYFIEKKLNFGSGSVAKMIHKPIKTEGHMSRVSIIFTGSKLDPKPNKNYSFYWGTSESESNKINKYMVGGIRSVPARPGYLVATFKNVSTTEVGKLGLFVTYKDKVFNPYIPYSSQTLYFKATTEEFALSPDNDVDQKTQILTIPEALDKTIDTIFNEPAGAINASATSIADDGTNHYLIPIDVRVDMNLAMPGTVEGSTERAIQLGATELFSGVTSIESESFISISAGAETKAFFANSDDSKAKAVITFQITPNMPAYSKIPEIYAVEIGGIKATAESDPSMANLPWGSDGKAKVFVRGAGLSKKWDVVMAIAPGSYERLITRGVQKIGPGNYAYSVELSPILKIAFSSSPANANLASLRSSGSSDKGSTVICPPPLYVDNKNEVRRGAEKGLGHGPVNIDIVAMMRGRKEGPHKNKQRPIGNWLPIPPLNFCPLKLKLPAVPPGLMQSICDFSFHLTAELKVHLEQFYILCIPIAVLLCIIDVICSLMNPFKTILAIIRLFECLFDLLLLLPQISVPVMFLNLILHLLEILECILRKILWLIMAINALITAFKNAIPINPETEKVDARFIDWAAIQALEETISEYLFEMEADLDFLGPIMSILGMFLQLLQLLFRFPCRINMEGGDYICGIDGTLIGGLIRGKAMPGGPIDTNYLVPVSQTYSTDGDKGAIWSSDPEDMETFIPLSLCSGSDVGYFPANPTNLGKVYANESSEDGTILTNIIDEGSYSEKTYRGSGPDATADGRVTFTASATKSVTGFSIFESSPQITTFHFKESFRPMCFPFPFPGIFIPIRSYIDYQRPADSKILLFEPGSGSSHATQLKTKEDGNFISPQDGYAFLSGSGDARSSKPLTVEFNWVEYTVNEDSGEIEEEEKSATRTYDDVPSLVILDEAGDVYFPVEDGFVFEDGLLVSIEARVINQDAAKKLKKSREEETEVLNQDAVNDCIEVADGVESEIEKCPEPDIETHHYKSYPQIMFFDMRQIEDDLEDLCMPAQMNAEAIPDEDPDELIEIIEETSDCIQEFIDQVNEQRQEILDALDGLSQEEWDPETGTWLDAPNIPNFDVDVFTLNGKTLKDCLEDSVDKICKFVVNPLTTSFRVLEDEDIGSLGDLYRSLTVGDTFADGAPSMLGSRPAPALSATALVDASADDAEFPEEELTSGARFIGAREYAEGIGDNAVIPIGEEATIQIIPRDIYNNAINERAKLASKINLEIMSDTTGAAELETYEDEDGEESFVKQYGEVYQGILTSTKPGTVKLKASICDKTIKAFVTAPLSDVGEEVEADVDCIEDATIEEEASVDALGSVIKVDRILTVLFTRKAVATSGAGDDAAVAKPRPQTFGTNLEN